MVMSNESKLYYFYTIGCAFCKQADSVVDELNKEGHSYIPISATTDGVLYKVGDKNGVKFTQCLKNESADVFATIQEGGNIFKPFAEADPVLYKKLQEFPVLRLLEQSRKA
jgi:hypothetical protein